MLSVLFLLNGNLCALCFHLCLCCAHPNATLCVCDSVCVFVDIFAHTSRPSYLFLHFSSFSHCALSLTHFNSWLFTLVVQEWGCSCIVGEVWPRRLIMCVFRILTFECNAISQSRRESEASHTASFKRDTNIFVVFAIFWFICNAQSQPRRIRTFYFEAAEWAFVNVSRRRCRCHRRRRRHRQQYIRHT